MTFPYLQFYKNVSNLQVCSLCSILLIECVKFGSRKYMSCIILADCKIFQVNQTSRLCEYTPRSRKTQCAKMSRNHVFLCHIDNIGVQGKEAQMVQKTINQNFLFIGMAAINAVLETLQSGDHVIASNKVKLFSSGLCHLNRIYPYQKTLNSQLSSERVSHVMGRENHIFVTYPT